MRRQIVVATAGIAWFLLTGAAAGASSSAAWRVQSVPRPANSTVFLAAVSCPTAAVCTAVGNYTDKATGDRFALAEQRNGGSWVIQLTPSTGGSVIDDQFFAVSCLSVSDCTAVGATFTGELAEHWDGTNWKVQPTPGPAGQITGELDAVSCFSSTNCTATGEYTSSARRSKPLAEHWDGSTWTLQAVPSPAGTTGVLFGDGVSCPAATDCTAVGEALTNTGSSFFAENWNGTKWQIQAMPTPAGTVNVQSGGVSCTAPSACTFAAGTLTSTGAMPVVERWNGTAWRIQTDAAPAGTLLGGVSCTSGSSCTAVGGNAGNTGVAEDWNGATWALETTPVPHQTTNAVSLNGVSCVSATDCTATGDYGRNSPLSEHE